MGKSDVLERTMPYLPVSGARSLYDATSRPENEIAAFSAHMTIRAR